MERKFNRIGVMGGTFDPIHLGHLFIAREAAHAADLDVVIFVPSGEAPHKRSCVTASAEERWDMTRIAIDGDPCFDASRIEVDREGPSYTADTLERLKAIYSESELYFITGYDAVVDIMKWRDPHRIARDAAILTVARPGTSISGIEVLPDDIKRAVRRVVSPLLEISSTDIRRRIADGRSIRYLVTDGVREYIERKGLYKTTG